jgi:hypothetical protein
MLMLWDYFKVMAFGQCILTKALDPLTSSHRSAAGTVGDRNNLGSLDATSMKDLTNMRHLSRLSRTFVALVKWTLWISMPMASTLAC